MNTSKLLVRICLALCLTVTLPVIGFSADPNTISATHREEQLHRLQNRLEEIKEMDTKGLSRHEKRELRKEVRTIKKEMAALSGGVYISVGAILLIALLLILLA